MKISQEEYEEQILRLITRSFDKATEKYIATATDGLNNNKTLLKPQKSHHEHSRERSSKSLEEKLSPLAHDICMKIAHIIQDYRDQKASLKEIFKTASRDARKIAKEAINNPTLAFNTDQLRELHTLQIKAIEDNGTRHTRATERIQRVLRNPFSRDDHVQLRAFITNDEIPTKYADNALPEHITGTQRMYAEVLLQDMKREYVLYSNAFKQLSPAHAQKVSTIINSHDFKTLRPFFKKAGTAKYIDNSNGLVTDRQKTAVHALLKYMETSIMPLEYIEEIERPLDDTKSLRKLDEMLRNLRNKSMETNASMIDSTITPLLSSLNTPRPTAMG